MNILLTGAAGFIGSHLAHALLDGGHAIAGLDNLNSYYDPALKQARLARLESKPKFRFAQADIADMAALERAAGPERYDVIVHLAAQAGVRHALTDPAAYTRSNLVGHHNVIEFARKHDGLAHLIYASSSSVYGNDTAPPYSESACAIHPVSFYGATKRAGELMSHSYAELYGLKQTGLRFFTVYGPWGRPDMAYWSFTDAILKGRAIPVYGQGKLLRDFTYIDDVVSAILRMVETPFAQAGDCAPHRLYNLGDSHPEEVSTLIRLIESAAGRKAIVEYKEGPRGDVLETYADISKAAKDFGFAPKTLLSDGIPRFVEWFRRYHSL